MLHTLVVCMETEQSIHGVHVRALDVAEASWKLTERPTARAVSDVRALDVAEVRWKLTERPTARAVFHLTHLAWEGVTTDVVRGRRTGVLLLAQATHVVHCVLAVSCHTTD